MDGLYNYKVQEPIFREYLRELGEEQLLRVARDYVFLCETSLGGPWKIDVFRRDVIREEFPRRGEPEFFEVADNFIRNSLKRL